MPPGTCRLCNGRHAEVNCRQYRTLSERIKRITRLDRCTTCLDFTYRCAGLCQNRCSRCDQPHHEALCSAVAPASSPAMPSTSRVFADTFTANRPTFGILSDTTTATAPQRGVRDPPSKRKTLLPPPVPQKKPKVDAVVGQPQPSGQPNAPPQDSRCVFCDNDAHSSAECTRYRTVAERKARLILKARCYRCWRMGHTAAFCRDAALTCARCGRADHHVAVCEDALTKTEIPSVSSSTQSTATAKIPAGTAKCSAKSSIFSALHVPSPTPSSAKGRAAKTSDVAADAARVSRSPAKSTPSTAVDAPAPTPSTANAQGVKTTDVKGTVQMTTAVKSLQVTSDVMDVTSPPGNRALNQPTAASRPLTLSVAKTTGVKREDKKSENSGANRSEEIPAVNAVAGRPLRPAESERDAPAATEVSESGRVSSASLLSGLPSSPEHLPTVPDSLMTSVEEPTSASAGSNRVLLQESVSAARITTDQENRKETTAACKLSDVPSGLGSSSSLAPRNTGHKSSVCVPEEVEDARAPGPSNDALKSVGDGTSCAAATEPSSIDPKPALAGTEDDRPSSITEQSKDPKNSESDSGGDHRETEKMPTTTSDVSDVASSRDDEPECDPKAGAETVESLTLIDEANGASEESPTSPVKAASQEVAESVTNVYPVCSPSADGVPALTPRGNDEQASQPTEPAVPVPTTVVSGPSEDKGFAHFATSTTDSCQKMDVDEAGTELSRLISELESATSGETANTFGQVAIGVEAVPSSDAHHASREPLEAAVKEESNVQRSSKLSASNNAPEEDERTAWLSQIQLILTPSKAESKVRASRTSASPNHDAVSSSVSQPNPTSHALPSGQSNEDALVAQEYALQKFAEDLQRLQEAEQAFEAEKAQFEGRKRTFDQECAMLNAMKAAVDAENEEARRVKQSTRDRTMNLKSKEQRLRDKEKKITETEDHLKSKERQLSALEKKMHDERRSIDAIRDSLATERADMEKERKSWHDKLRDYDERLKEERKKVEGYWRDVQEKEARCQRQMREVSDEFAALRRKQRDFDEEQRKQSSKYRSRSPHSSSRGSRERSSTDRYQSPSTSRHRSDELRQAEEEIRSLNHQLISAKYDVEDSQKNLHCVKEQRDDEAQRREKAAYEAQTLRRQLEGCTQTLTDRTEALNKAIAERSAAIKRAADGEQQWRAQQQHQADVIEKQTMQIDVLRWSIEFRKQRSERKLEEAKARKQQQQKNIAASTKALPASKTTGTKSAKPSVKREVCDDGYEPAIPGKAQVLGTSTNAVACTATVPPPSTQCLTSVLTGRTSELLLRFPQKTVEKYIAFMVTNLDYFKNVQTRELTDFLKHTDPENAELSEAISQIYSSVPPAR